MIVYRIFHLQFDLTTLIRLPNWNVEAKLLKIIFEILKSKLIYL